MNILIEQAIKTNTWYRVFPYSVTDIITLTAQSYGIEHRKYIVDTVIQYVHELLSVVTPE